MFLPVLLLRDLGIWGFVVFAVPNVLGAAAMGWVLTDAEQSREMVRRHELACAWFSLITIAFHAFFAAWLIQIVAGSIAGAALAAGVAAFWLILQWRKGGAFAAATLALLTSALAAAWGFSRHEIPYVARSIPGIGLPHINAIWLAIACIFGFGLCPYLDLTFHAARQSMNRVESRIAFLLGFGGVFGAMVLFTLAYSGVLVADFDRHVYPQIAMILSVHLIAQSALTIALHVRQLGALREFRMSHLLLFGVVLIVAVGLGTIDFTRFFAGFRYETVYRCFLGFYAIVFPTYVWLRVVPGRRSMVRVLVVVVIAIPLFWMAFVERQMIWFLPGVAAPLLAKWIGARGQATAD